MEFNKYLKRFSIAIFTLLTLSIIASSAIHLLEKKSAQLQNTKTVFLSAISSSQVLLKFTVNAIASDNMFKSNIKKKLNYSVVQNLQSKIHPGQVDAALLLSENCEVLSQGKVAQFSIKPCSGTKPKEGFIWHQKQKTPVLVYTQKYQRINDQMTYLQAQLILSDNWIRQHPKLAQDWNTYQIKFEDNPNESSSAIITSFANTAEKNAPIYITTADFLLRLYPWDINKVSQHYWLGYWPIILAIFLLIAFIYYLKVQSRENREALDSLYDISQKIALKDDNELIIAKTENLEITSTEESSLPTNKEVFKEVESILSSLEKDQKNRINLLRREINSIENKLASAELRNTNLASQISKLINNEATIKQVKRTSNQLTTFVEKIHETTKDISSILAVGLTEKSNILSSIMEDWYAGCKEKSPRKFFRSLSETQGTDIHTTMLDDQIKSIFDLGQSIADQAISVQFHCKKLLSEANILKDIPSQWSELDIDMQTLPQSTESLNIVLRKVHFLLSKDAKFNHYKLDVSELSRTPDFGTIPQGIWSTAVYHLIIAMLEAAAEVGYENIFLHYKENQDNQLLIFSYKEPQTEKLKYDHEAVKSHLRLVNKILKAYNASYEILRTPNSADPIAIKWHSNQITKQVAQKATSRKEIRI